MFKIGCKQDNEQLFYPQSLWRPAQRIISTETRMIIGLYSCKVDHQWPPNNYCLTWADWTTSARGQGAGDLWKKCTGSPVTAMECCVYNCPNQKCNLHLGTSHAQKAGATAHVYGTFQSSDHDIRYMILLPTCSTCSTCNNYQQCLSSKTNFPTKGEEPANIL